MKLMKIISTALPAIVLQFAGNVQSSGLSFDSMKQYALSDVETGVRATYHEYSKSDSPTTNACQMPFSQDGPLMVTAVDASIFGKGMSCGDCLLVQNGETTAVVQVVDLKGAPGLDLAPDAFNALGGSIANGFATVSFYKVPCNYLSQYEGMSYPSISYRFKAGSNADPYLGMMIVNHLVPVTSVSISPTKDGVYTPCSMDANNWWICSNHAPLNLAGNSLPMYYVQIKGSTGEVLTDAIYETVAFDESEECPSKAAIQFSSPAGPSPGSGSQDSAPTTAPVPTTSAPSKTPLSTSTSTSYDSESSTSEAPTPCPETAQSATSNSAQSTDTNNVVTSAPNDNGQLQAPKSSTDQTADYNSSSASHGLSAGSIIIIAVGAVALVGMIAGVVYMKTRKTSNDEDDDNLDRQWASQLESGFVDANTPKSIIEL